MAGSVLANSTAITKGHKARNFTAT